MAGVIRVAYCVVRVAGDKQYTKYEIRNTFPVSDENIVTMRILKYLVIVQHADNYQIKILTKERSLP
jgi:hypothetical protein